MVCVLCVFCFVVALSPTKIDSDFSLSKFGSDLLEKDDISRYFTLTTKVDGLFGGSSGVAEQVSSDVTKWSTMHEPFLVIGCPHRFAVDNFYGAFALVLGILVGIVLTINLKTCNNRFYNAKLLKYSCYFDDLYQGLMSGSYRKWTVPQAPPGTLNDPKAEAQRRS